jgi:hypothetical protein
MECSETTGVLWTLRRGENTLRWAVLTTTCSVALSVSKPSLNLGRVRL